MPGVTPVGTADRRWTEHAERAGVLGPGKSAHGKTAEQTKKAQHGSPVVEAAMTGGHVAAEGVVHALEGASGVSAGLTAVLLGPVLTLVTFGYELTEAHSQGEELREAYARDAVNLAFVYAAASALPSDYVAKIRVDLRAVDGERGGAMKILNRAMASDKEWQAMQKQAAEHVRIGRAAAKRFGVTSPQALEQRLKSDPRFGTLYNNNLGFKHGVDSVLYENAQRRLHGAG